MIITNETIISFNPVLEREAMMKFEEQHPDWKKEESTVLYSYRQRSTVNVFNALQHFESVGEKTDCVEVVRCKDCRNRQNIGMGAHRWCDVVSGSRREDDFCSYGERK